jgi:hypothetical protein
MLSNTVCIAYNVFFSVLLSFNFPPLHIIYDELFLLLSNLCASSLSVDYFSFHFFIFKRFFLFLNGYFSSSLLSFLSVCLSVFFLFIINDSFRSLLSCVFIFVLSNYIFLHFLPFSHIFDLWWWRQQKWRERKRKREGER